MLAETVRLLEADQKGIGWRKWGPYFSERQWGSVREDYSGDGDAWNYFTHDQARSRPYRWGEDGIRGISDNRRDYILFYEYFHGDNGAGIGASHQTGWTGTAANLIQLFGYLKASDALAATARLARSKYPPGPIEGPGASETAQSVETALQSKPR